MIHIGRNTRSTIVSKGISAGHGQNTYRGLVKVLPSAADARNFTQCDSLLMGRDCGAHTFPYVEVQQRHRHRRARGDHFAIGDDQLFYCLQRGLSEEDAVNMIVSGFCKTVFKELPMEFAVEAQNLLAREPGRSRRLMGDIMLRIRNLHGRGRRQRRCSRDSTWSCPRAKCTPSWARTARARARLRRCSPGAATTTW